MPDEKDKLPGLREAIRVIRGMGSDWPDAIGTADHRYGEQFIRRIEERIEGIERR